jgi:hypothetical protein
MEGPDSEALPEWPQPAGIFKKGEAFDTVQFFNVIHKILNNIAESGIGSNEEIVLEHAAFFKLLSDRIEICSDDSIVFKMFSMLRLDPPVPDDFFVEHNGHRCLRLDCLRTPDDISPQAETTMIDSSSLTVPSDTSADEPVIVNIA